MSFPTIEFAAFFLVVYVLSWLSMPHPRLWRPFILVVSYFFYGWVDPRWVLLLIGSSVVNTFAAQVIARTPSDTVRKRALIAAIVFDVGLLAVFKYLGFFVDSTNDALTDVGLGTPLPLMQVVLPIGISFFTFQAISYVVDVYRRDTPAASLGDVAILQAFFPHLVAGPIVRANELLPQLRTPRDPRAVLAGPALLLIAGGFVKKTVVADELARRIVDPVFNDPLGRSGPEVVLAIYGFAGQIYCDFSGYTDMAIGLALLLGFKLPQNFDRPYTATSLRQFWRRWHMTLSRWLRDYLYIPLGGSREGPRRTYRNLMATMLIGGLWHGAAWTFVIWGAIHGTALSIERALRHAIQLGATAAVRRVVRDLQRRVPRLGVLPRAGPRHGLRRARPDRGRRALSARDPPRGGARDRGRGRAGRAARVVARGRGLARGPARARPGARARVPRRRRGCGRGRAGRGPVHLLQVLTCGSARTERCRCPRARCSWCWWWRSPWPRSSTPRRSSAPARA